MSTLILIVDDEPKIRKQARDYLERAGYRVRAAGDGPPALSIAAHERPDMVVLDLNLPSSPTAEALDGLDVCRAGAPIHLTRTEFNLLATLAQHPGQAFSRAQLLDRLHGVAYDGYDRSVDAHVKNLRHKLEADPANPRYVLTVYGIGYKSTDEL